MQEIVLADKNNTHKIDLEAVTLWLTTKGTGSDNTFRAYKREATRFLNWLDYHQLLLKDVSAKDIQQFLFYLENPSQYKMLSNNAEFKGLSKKSINYTRTILNQIFSYLQDMGHINKNVINLTKKHTLPVEDTHTRFLDINAWEWLWMWLLSRPALTDKDIIKNARNRWIFALLYHTGIRRDEVAQGSMYDFNYKNCSWSLKIIGKRKKIRHVTVNSVLVHELKRYRTLLNLDELPGRKDAENYGLILPINGSKHKRLCARSIGRIVHDVRELALLDCEDVHIQNQISEFSTHWLRHTNATHRALAGSSMETTKDELGHADPKTTLIYMKTADKARKRDAEKLANLSNLNIQKEGE